VRGLARELSLWLAKLELCPKVKGEVSAERMKALRELGYAGDDDGSESDGAVRDEKK